MMSKSIATLLGLFTVSSLFSYSNSCEMDCNPCPCPCPEVKTLLPPCDCAYNAPYRLDFRCGWDLFVTGSLLYWKPTEENIEIGEINISTLKTTTIGRTLSINDIKNSIEKQLVNFKYNLGFKAGLGIDFCYDNWELYGEYTYHHSKNKIAIPRLPKEFTTKSGLTQTSSIVPFWNLSIVPINSREPTTSIIKTASGEWNLKLDLGDLELARKYYVGNHLVFRTFGGLRVAWIKQTYSAHYKSVFTGGFGTDHLSPEISSLEIDLSTDFISLEEQEADPGATLKPQPPIFTSNASLSSWGVGPRVGVDTEWLLCKGFRIFLDSSASILFTKYTTETASTHSSSFLLHPTPPNIKTITNTSFINSDDPCFLRPQAEITIGSGWGDYFACGKFYLDIEVGYTFNVFWNQNMFPGQMNTTDVKEKGGDLYFQGLIVSASFAF